jgi:hypothetical protein
LLVNLTPEDRGDESKIDSLECLKLLVRVKVDCRMSLLPPMRSAQNCPALGALALFASDATCVMEINYKPFRP